MRALNYKKLILVAALLSVEFVDELIDAFKGLSLPFIRQEFALSFTELGLLRSLPFSVGCLVEVLIGFAALRLPKTRLICSGGAVFAAALFICALAPSYPWLLAGFVLFYPASGVFVGLSQAKLMDESPKSEERAMNLWTVAGGCSHIVAPLILLLIVSCGYSWRLSFVLAGVISLAGVILIRLSQGTECDQAAKPGQCALSFRQAVAKLFKPAVLKWLIMLELADLMLDVFSSFLPLYFGEVLGFSPQAAALLVFARAAAALAGEAALILLLRKVAVFSYLRVSALAALAVYPLFLISRSVSHVLILLVVLSVLTAGWYALQKAQLYKELGEDSGLILVLGLFSVLLRSVLPVVLGLVADHAGLWAALALLVVGPLVMALRYRR